MNDRALAEALLARTMVSKCIVGGVWQQAQLLQLLSDEVPGSSHKRRAAMVVTEHVRWEHVWDLCDGSFVIAQNAFDLVELYHVAALDCTQS